MYTICFGIPALGFTDEEQKAINDDGFIIDYIANEECDIWNDFELTKNDAGYHFGFETAIGFPNKDGAAKWIKYCLNKLNDYMVSHNYDTTKELSMYQVFTEGVNVNSDFETIEDAYAFLKLMANGFNGEGLFVGE